MSHSDGENSFMTGGSDYRLLVTLAETFNFSYKVLDCDGHWGSLLPNNSWTGIVGKLASRVSQVSNVHL